MKNILTLIFALNIFTISTFGQNSKYQFANQVFRRNYKKQVYEKYHGTVKKIDNNTFRYGDKVLSIQTDDEKLAVIFSTGAFYPDIIGGKYTTKPLLKAQLDTMSENSILFYNMSRNDSISIGQIEQLEKLNPNYKTKRFVFWLYNKAMLNPTECYFELYNAKGKENMSIKEFIKNSKLTFYHRGTIII